MRVGSSPTSGTTLKFPVYNRITMEEDRNAPATKGDLQDQLHELELRIDGKLRDLEARIEGKLDASEQRLLDAMRGIAQEMETRLLSAFYGYSQNNDKRLGQVESNEHFLSDRVAALESRMLELEKRVNFPNQPPQ